MIKRVVVGALLAAVLLGTGIAIGSHGNWERGHDAVVVHGTGSGGTDGQTIVVSDGHWGGPGFFFFPFGLLFFVLVFVLVASAVRGARRGGHWHRVDRGPAWLDDWHRRAHDEPDQKDDGGTSVT